MYIYMDYFKKYLKYKKKYLDLKHFGGEGRDDESASKIQAAESVTKIQAPKRKGWFDILSSKKLEILDNFVDGSLTEDEKEEFQILDAKFV